MPEDLALPKAAIAKLVKEALPGDMGAASDAADLISQCCSEFVQLVSSEASEISIEEKRSTIGPEHIIKALEKLGFDHYVPEATDAWHQLRDDAKGQQQQELHSGRSSAAASGVSEQKQIELQQQLLASAREQSGMDYVYTSPTAPGSQPGG